jgi:hypothetical protein
MRISAQLPFKLAFYSSVLMNVFPAFMAFVVQAEGWAQAGWAFYFLTIPLSVALLLIGGVVSIVLGASRRQGRRR